MLVAAEAGDVDLMKVLKKTHLPRKVVHRLFLSALTERSLTIQFWRDSGNHMKEQKGPLRL